jgi:hypothetical protein
MRYVAKIKVAGKTLHLGYFSRKSEADIRVLTTSARNPPLRSARFEAEIALLPF